jgi:hypothetical protein
MAAPVFRDGMTLGEARELFFETYGIGREYDVRWVRLRARWFTFYFPNATGRVRAAKLHDLHHIATAYPTTWTGEAEIGAWEIASGCGKYGWAWYFNLYAFLIGLAIAPRATHAAFRRGRHSRNLYHLEPGFRDELLAEKVGALRARLRLGDFPARARDSAWFAAWAAGAVLVQGVAPVWLVFRLAGMG